MKSILQTEKRCYMCGSVRWLELHHIFNAYNKKNSEKYGLLVYLCHYCHNEPPNGVHHNAKNRITLQANAQKAAMKYYGWSEDDFRSIFHKNYL